MRCRVRRSVPPFVSTAARVRSGISTDSLSARVVSVAGAMDATAVTEAVRRPTTAEAAPIAEAMTGTTIGVARPEGLRTAIRTGDMTDRPGATVVPGPGTDRRRRLPLRHRRRALRGRRPEEEGEGFRLARGREAARVGRCRARSWS